MEEMDGLKGRAGMKGLWRDGEGEEKVRWVRGEGQTRFKGKQIRRDAGQICT